MTARILVVDDEPDLEALIQQKFRHQIGDGVFSFLFARDGVEAFGAFAAHVGMRADDQLASFHLKRLLNGASGTRIAMD